MTTEEFETRQSKMTDKVLLEALELNISKLCKTGGKSFSMSVPPSIKDTDMLICELVNRYKKLINN